MNAPVVTVPVSAADPLPSVDEDLRRACHELDSGRRHRWVLFSALVYVVVVVGIHLWLTPSAGGSCVGLILIVGAGETERADTMPFEIEVRAGPAGSEIWLIPVGAATRPCLTAYCVGALRMPEGWSDGRLAAAIYRRHHVHPDDAALWHIGADTPDGALLGDAFRKPDASHIAAFLAGAGDFGLWWPETWRNVSAHLRARPALAGLSVVLLLGRVDRAPHYWGDAEDNRGKTLRELGRLQGCATKAV